MKRGLFILLIAVSALLAGFAGNVAAETPENGPATGESPAPAVEPEGEEVVIRGMQMFIDEKSGALRPPTATEAALMTKMMEQMFGKRRFEPQLNVDKDGMMSAELGEEFMEFSMVRVEADGSLTMDCVDGIEEARAYVAATAGAGLEEE